MWWMYFRYVWGVGHVMDIGTVCMCALAQYYLFVRISFFQGWPLLAAEWVMCQLK